MDELIAFITARLDEDEADSWPDYSVLPPSGFPARIAAGIAASRAILAAHPPEDFVRYGLKGTIDCGTCVTDHDTWLDLARADPWPCRTVRILASVWSDHPDYRAEWAPEGA